MLERYAETYGARRPLQSDGIYTLSVRRRVSLQLLITLLFYFFSGCTIKKDEVSSPRTVPVAVQWMCDRLEPREILPTLRTGLCVLFFSMLFFFFLWNLWVCPVLLRWTLTELSFLSRFRYIAKAIRMGSMARTG